MNHYPVDIKNEGFVKVIQRGKVNSTNNKNLKDYLFYLTYNNRATVINGLNNEINFKENKHYSYFFDIKNELKKNKQNTIHTIELIMSFSSTYNKVVASYYGIDNWEKMYINKVEEILNKYLKQYINYTSFYHKFDSTMYRLHNHSLVMPYIKEEKNITKNKKNINIKLKLLRPYLSQEVLENIKKEFKIFGIKTWNSIPNNIKKELEKNVRKMKRRFLKKESKEVKLNMEKQQNSFKDIILEKTKLMNKKKYYYYLKTNFEDFFIHEMYLENFDILNIFIDTCLNSNFNSGNVFSLDRIMDKVLRTKNQWLLLKTISLAIKLKLNFEKYLDKINRVFTVGKDYKYLFETLYDEKQNIFKYDVQTLNELLNNKLNKNKGYNT